jgi:hypothetical protein
MTKTISTEGLSMLQALGIWDDLLEAYHGVNRYGGDTAEIYGYRLSERCPSSEAAFPGAILERDTNATQRLKAMIRLFVGCRSDAKVTVDGVPWNRWKELLSHRCHVKVTRKGRKSR